MIAASDSGDPQLGPRPFLVCPDKARRTRQVSMTRASSSVISVVDRKVNAGDDVMLP
jgi:hypothetical protein